MTLEFRVPHDVDTDASPAPSARPDARPSHRSPRSARPPGRPARGSPRPTAGRPPARARRPATAAHRRTGVVEQGWIQHSWFAYLDEHGRLRKASSAAALAAQGRPLVAACLVGAVVSAAGGPQVVHSQPVQRALDLVWHALAADEGRPVVWCPAPDVRMARVRDLTTWNDRPGRSAAEVASLLLTAERVAVHEAERVAARRVPLPA